VPRLPRIDRLRLTASLAACALLAWGCGQSGPKLAPVSGKVTLDGKPLPGGTVSFYADATKGNQSKDIPTGKIKEGSYELLTEGRKGAPPGAYKVVVFADQYSTDAPPLPIGTAEQPRSIINTRYNRPDRTPLAVEVVDKPAAGAYDLKLTR
jgi:hypothetical protein